MSLVTFPNSTHPKVSIDAAKSRSEQTAWGASKITSRLRSAFAAAGRTLVKIHKAIAEARLHRAMIEAELYRNRYLHTSKNDDDLPVLR
jgi:hypothetical protein